MNLQELFTDESKWTKGYYARNENGNPVAWQSPNATCWCFTGAILKCYPANEADLVMGKVYNMIRDKFIFAFNDNPETKFADIRRVIEKLDI